jgi:hypothetical protein
MIELLPKVEDMVVKESPHLLGLYILIYGGMYINKNVKITPYQCSRYI